MAASEKSSSLSTLSWAVYLGCSWTWCIGMFLPVILIVQFGNAAWFVFAIPNVLGAAAMGWILWRKGSSEQIVVQHRTACVGFSAVTLAFHLFFLFWMTNVGIIPIPFACVAIGSGIVGGVLSRRFHGLDLMLGWVVLAVSLTVFVRGLLHPVFGVKAGVNTEHLAQSLTGLAVACVFGFLLCPYLDVTFHRARQKTSASAARFVFSIGFGVVFLAMIVLTLMYAGDFKDSRDSVLKAGSFGFSLLVTWVAFHIVTQAGYTFVTHLRALPAFKTSDIWIWVTALIFVIAGCVAVEQQQYFDYQTSGSQMYTGELVYRLFMSFYGLVFPAYVWVFIVPLNGKVVERSILSLTIWIASLVVAAPMFWVGFINLHMLWLIPGTALVIVARFVADYLITVSVKRVAVADPVV